MNLYSCVANNIDSDDDDDDNYVERNKVYYNTGGLKSSLFFTITCTGFFNKI